MNLMVWVDRNGKKSVKSPNVADLSLVAANRPQPTDSSNTEARFSSYEARAERLRGNSGSRGEDNCGSRGGHSTGGRTQTSSGSRGGATDGRAKQREHHRSKQRHHKRPKQRHHTTPRAPN